jgi:gamma-glutamyltranspeptidase/glutathione hydrolase
MKTGYFQSHRLSARVFTLLWCFSLFCDETGFGGSRGAVATVHPLATEAALEAFRKDGNAIDAVVAAALTLGVVDGHNSGIGGGCFLLIRRPGGELLAVDGRETAPTAASRDMFVRNGQAVAELSQTGPLAVGVPGALAAYEYATRRYGKMAFKDLLLNAANFADRGFVVDATYAQRLASTADDLRKFPGAREIFLNPRGDPRKAGESFKQPDLAKTYRSIANRGIDWFYRGAFAEAVSGWMKQNGGLLRSEDFAKYEIRLREPIRTTYRGFEIVGFPPPSSGGVQVAQILNIVEHFDLKAMGAGSADCIHVVSEATKLAFADRAFWLGDPDFAAVPRGLAAKDYAATLANRIRVDRAAQVPAHAQPENASSDIFGKHTTHFCAADGEGNWVACTATINTSFGSKVVVPGTGIVLNNQMDDFSAQPGAANYFGLVGSEANAVAPGKRPLSSMSPTLVLRNGKPVFSVGAAGGPTIITQVVLAIIGFIDFGMSPGEALAQPRFHHQWKPDELVVENRISEPILQDLERRGHKVKRVETIGTAQAISESESGKFTAVHDPRVRGQATAW